MLQYGKKERSLAFSLTIFIGLLITRLEQNFGIELKPSSQRVLAGRKLKG